MSELTVVNVGDIMLQRRIQWDSAAFPGSLLAGADLTFGNLEAPVSDRGWRQDKIIALRTPAAAGVSVRDMGLDVVSFANNHSLDYGYEALFDTLEIMEALGVSVVGAGASLEQAMAPAILERKGRTVACFGFSSTIPLGAAAASDRPGMAPIRVKQTIEADTAAMDEQPGTAPYVHTWALPEDVAQAQAAIAKAKQAGHLVLVHIHWGVPHGWAPLSQGWLADYQQPLGRALVDAGADAIFGHHAHVIHGAELYKGRPIFYSLGNFLFHTKAKNSPPYRIGRPIPPWKLKHLKSPLQLESFVVAARFGSEGFTGAEIRPIILNEENAEPAAAPPAVARAIMERCVAMSAEVNTRIELRDEGTWGVLSL